MTSRFDSKRPGSFSTNTKITFTMCLSRDDPFAALGVLYPLAVFLRHGKVNLELITGEGGPGGEDEQ